MTHPRLCCIEIQVQSNLDRDHFMVRYLVRRASFWVSIMHKILFLTVGDTLVALQNLEPV